MQKILNELRAKGVSEFAIEEIEKWGREFERRREWNRAAQAKHRLRKSDISLTSQPIENIEDRKSDIRLISTTVPSKVSLTTSKDLLEISLVAPGAAPKPKRTTGQQLPSDWKPRQQEIDEGLKLGWSLIGIEAKADDMRIWATANANRAIARKADWHATFRGMLRRDKPKSGAGPPVDIEAGQKALKEYLERDRREQLNGKRHEAGIRPNTNMGQDRPDDKGQLRFEGGGTHGDPVQSRKVADAISAVVRNLRVR